MNIIIIVSRGHAKKFNVPRSGQDEPNDDYASAKSGRSKKLTDR
jgi:hypothetical protein